ncbi:MAG TPA: hypothetical protein VIG32_05645 [Candidatus Baltobacteraceae bacterium]|jgi:hypothetical protein
MPRTARIVLVALLMLLFAGVAVDRSIYDVTSPGTIPFHVLLRKGYSVVVFVLGGASLAWAAGLRPRFAALCVLLFSLAIEIAQRWHGSTESFGSNVLDTLLGGIGGYIGAALVPRRKGPKTNGLHFRD